MSKKNFTIRLSDELRHRLEAVLEAKIEKSGRYTPLSNVIEAAIVYGIEVVEQELNSEILLPISVKSETEKAISVARQLIEIGARHAGEAA